MRSRVAREQAVVAWMFRRHCRKAHATPRPPCPACARLTAAAQRRLERCPHGEAKPSCTRCEIRCFSKEELEGIREMMLAAGPGFSAFRVVLFGMKQLDRLRALGSTEGKAAP